MSRENVFSCLKRIEKQRHGTFCLTTGKYAFYAADFGLWGRDVFQVLAINARSQLMTKQEVRAWIEEIGVIAAVRERSMESALYAGDTVARSGIPTVEIATTVPQFTTVISHLAKTVPGIVVGAGSVTQPETARLCLDAGAQFLTSDGFHPAVSEFAAQHAVVIIPGALTPTEVINAWEAPADFVKVVPCAQLGGPPFIASLHAMFPHIPLVASGGVDQQSASKLIIAGAIAIGVGRELLPKDAVQLRQTARIGELARRFLDFVKSGRAHLEAYKRQSTRVG
jgi:2-dehydro-3-deoxyphosphogluconate aldolase / (4S)-4-hydroxy-2-oxoglutarate aldolase